MNIEIHNQEGNVAMKLDGRLDSTTAGELEEAMTQVLEEDISSLTIDLGDVDFISSKGLRILVSAYKKLSGKEMTLLSPNASILEVLRMSGLLKVFTIK